MRFARLSRSESVPLADQPPGSLPGCNQRVEKSDDRILTEGVSLTGIGCPLESRDPRRQAAGYVARADRRFAFQHPCDGGHLRQGAVGLTGNGRRPAVAFLAVRDTDDS